MTTRGQLAQLDQHWLVVVSTDSLADVLPTSWALLATPEPGPLGHPLQIALAANSSGTHPSLWIRTTQIRTVATEQLRPVGTVPAHILAEIDRILPRILGLPDGNDAAQPRLQD